MKKKNTLQNSGDADQGDKGRIALQISSQLSGRFFLKKNYIRSGILFPWKLMETKLKVITERGIFIEINSTKKLYLKKMKQK